MQTKERGGILWQGQPSYLLNLPQYFYGALFAALLMPADFRIGLIPLAICIWYWLTSHAEKYELTNSQLTIHSGVLSKRVEVINLSAIKDFHILQPWFFKSFALSTIVLIVDDSLEFQPCIRCIPNADELIVKMRQLSGAI